VWTCANALDARPDGRVLAVPLRRASSPTPSTSSSLDEVTAQFEHVEALDDVAFVLKSIGYDALPCSASLDVDASGALTHAGARALLKPSANTSFCDMLTQTAASPSIYVAGWLKRGSTGIVASNKFDAQETVAAVRADIDGGVVRTMRDEAAVIAPTCLDRIAAAVSYDDWLRLDAYEREQGVALGVERVKVADADEQIARAKL